MFRVLKTYLQPMPNNDEMLLEIRNAWINFFEQLDKNSNVLELPAHERANKVLKEIIDSNGIAKEYNRIKKLRGF